MASRRSATRARTLSGLAQLRWNRMKPSGSASRRKRRYSAVRAGPAQPKMTARGSRLDKDAPDAATLEFPAVALGGRGIRDRSGLDAVEDAAFAEIDARRAESRRPQQVAMLALETLPFLLGALGRAHRAE